MCGIVACFSASGDVRAAALGAGVQALRHRGPDGQRVWVAPHARAGLGHARLSIIDLETGDQPIASEDESLRIVVNGEFYGYQAVREELRGRGHRLSTASDSEIALHLYEESGPASLSALRGEFALALWDERRGALFAARDRFGVKPLYYAEHTGTLWLASEAKSLFAAGVPAAWDRESVHQHLALGAPVPGRTLFAGVRQLPPGHYLVADAAGVRLTRYWDLDLPLDGPRAWTAAMDAEFVRAFRECLEDAVRERLHADVPVGAYLSGGLDSSVILGLAARHAPRPLAAFTVGFERAAYDESATAEATARHCGADWRPLRVTQRDLADRFADSVWQSETSCGNAHGVAKYLLSAHVHRSGYKVVLTGEGSDELLAGYAFFRRDGGAASGAGAPDSAAELEPVRAALGTVPGWILANHASYQRHRPLLDPGFAESAAEGELYALLLGSLDVEGQLRGRHPLDRSLYLWARTALPHYILTVGGDRMEMAHSVEGRLPFLDHRLAELLRRLPPAAKLDAPEKRVLREAARDVLTDAVYTRRKQPFVAPPALVEPDDPLQDRILGILRGPALGALPFYERERVLRLLDELPGMRPADRLTLDPMLMHVASLAVLQERFSLA